MKNYLNKIYRMRYKKRFISETLSYATFIVLYGLENICTRNPF